MILATEQIKAKALMAEAASRLAAANIPEAPREAETLLTEITGIRREDIYSHDPIIPHEKAEQYRNAYLRRAGREPLQYITGTVEFDGLEFSVGKGVLVPRPETELLVAEVVKRVEAPERVLDLCTGSGCIAISLARRFPRARVLGTDVSGEALRYARKNADKLGISNVEFLEGEGFAPAHGQSFDLIVSNPPYIAEGEIEALEPEVKDWEPRGALVSGPEGVEFYRVIAREAGRYMDRDAFLALELGAGQADAVCAMIEVEGFSGVETVLDFSETERMLFCFWGN